MNWYEYIFIFIVILGAFNTAYQLYRMVQLDAKSRGFKHPKIWGLLATGGQNCGGLLLYLLSRRNYPSNMSEDEINSMNSRKKRIGICLIFLTVGSICLIISLISNGRI